MATIAHADLVMSSFMQRNVSIVTPFASFSDWVAYGKIDYTVSFSAGVPFVRTNKNRNVTGSTTTNDH